LDTTRVVQLSDAALNAPNLPLPELAQIVQLNSQLGSLTNVDTERVVKLCDAIFNRPNVSLPELSQIVQIYFQMGSLTKLDTARVIQLCDSGLTSSNTTVGEVGHIANIFSMLNNLPKLQTALQKLVALQPNEPEARFDLARLEATLGQTNPALNDLKTALEQSQARLKADPKARDLTQEARTDPTLNSLRNLPAFQTLVPAK
jgi:hypothetical protein